MDARKIPIWRGARFRRSLGAAGVVALLAAMTPAMAQVYVNVGPPAPRVEVVPPVPGPGWAWRAGHWGWRGGRWVWIAGAYARGPHPGAIWVAGHWAQRPRGWVWVEGHWR